MQPVIGQDFSLHPLAHLESTQDEQLPWYAVHVRSHAEANVALGLRQKGFEQFYPTYRKQTQWSDRVRTLDLPLFPGYVFCRFDIALRRGVVITPGVLKVVGFGKEFVPIPEGQIKKVQDIMRSGLLAAPWPFLKEGQRVIIRTGSLSGLEGLLVQLKNECRVVVSIPLLQRSVAVEIDRNWIQPV